MTWPEPVNERISREVGAPIEVRRLGGMSGAGVWLARGDRGSLVVKRTSQREAAFYREVAPDLRAGGVPVVGCDWMHDEPDGSWLLLEAIPSPLPDERRLADPELIDALRRLHALTWDRPPVVSEQYAPAWTNEMTAAGDAFGVPGLLARLQSAAQPLFAPRCAISGDPNPRNWGARADGSLALFDWERYAAGTPPLDLAITIPGLGDITAFESIAERYLIESPDEIASEWSMGGLAREIALAKIWSAVEFVATQPCARDGVAGSVLDWLQREVPTWLPCVAAYALDVEC